MNPSSNTVGRLRERLREETSSVILSAAEQVIAEDGLHAARMERIAAAAGISVGTLYNYFKDRTALIQALFDARAAGLRDRLAEALARVEGRGAREQVEAVLTAMASHAEAHGRFFSALIAEHQGPSRLRPPVAVRMELSARSQELVSRAIAAGEFRDDPAGIFAEALVALARLVLTRAIEKTLGPDEIAALADLYVRGVGR